MFKIVQQRLHSHFCSLLVFKSNADLHSLASGVLVKYRERSFVATAGHVLDSNLPGSKMVLDYGQAIRFFASSNPSSNFKLHFLGGIPESNFLGRTFCRVESSGQPKRDVGLVEILVPEVAMRHGKTFVELPEYSAVLTNDCGLVEIWGNCFDITAENFHADVRNCVTSVHTKLCKPNDTEFSRIFFKYDNVDGREDLYSHGRYLQTFQRSEKPRPAGGMSGGPIWTRDDCQEMPPGGIVNVRFPRLVGLQSGAEDGMLVGAKIQDWMTLANEFLGV